jgi:Ca-activated chloride channel family protein
MIRARAVSAALLVSAAAALALPVAADEGPPSPAKVLERVDAGLGKGFVSLPERRALADGEDKTLAPFFYVAGGDPETERLPVKGISAEVRIAGVIANVKEHQLFENTGKKPIEAVYVFPASTRAAVHGMRMKIGARTVEAKIEKRETARREYEAAKQSGRRASLLEQQRANVFTMNVANLMPGDRIDVELDYSELLVPEDSIYEFVLPTVVGPRYGGGADADKDKWIANPYLPEGSAEPFPFDVKVHLESGIALKEVASPSHAVSVKYASPGSADVALEHSGGGDKDYVLRYRLAGDRIEAGTLLFGDGRESFFLTMIEPPRRPTAEAVLPREYVFVLDVSGSMYGFPLATAKALLHDLVGSLRPTDWFDVVLFSGTSYTMSPHGSVPATAANIAEALALVDSQRGGGGTELLDALRAAYAIPKTGGDAGALSRSVIVATDGYVGVEAQAFKFIRERLSEANLFAFGIGSSVNRALIEGMARAGQGEPFVVLRAEKAHEQSERLRTYVDAPLLSRISVEYDGFDAYDVAPQRVPDLMAKRPIVLFGKYRGGARGKLRVRGLAAGSTFSQEVDLGAAAVRAEASPLRFLWARKWIETLDDERALASGDARLEQEITRLGLDYTLLTAFTSFVAVDSKVVNQGGRHESVSQPLPLPEGVSNYAVGNAHAANSSVGVVGHGYGAGGGGHGALGGYGGSAGYGAAMMRSRASTPHVVTATPRVQPMAPPPAPPAEPKPAPSLARLIAPEAAARTARDSSGLDNLVDGDSGGAHDKRIKGEDEKAPRPRTAAVRVSHVDDARAAASAIEQAMRAAIAEVPGAGAGNVTVKLVVDAAGKVTRVEVSGAGGARLAAALRKLLEGTSVATRASGAAEGSVEVVVRLER